MTPAFIIGTLVCSFLITYLFFIGITWRDWTHSRKELIECWFQMTPTISLLLTVFVALALCGGRFTAILFDPVPKSKTQVTEMIVQDVGYANGKLCLVNSKDHLQLRAPSKWEGRKFPTNIKYVITHRDGHLLSCYPKEDPSLVPDHRIKTAD